jgi:multidrug efflux pump subunit AcrB
MITLTTLVLFVILLPIMLIIGTLIVYVIALAWTFAFALLGSKRAQDKLKDLQ